MMNHFRNSVAGVALASALAASFTMASANEAEAGQNSFYYETRDGMSDLSIRKADPAFGNQYIYVSAPSLTPNFGVTAHMYKVGEGHWIYDRASEESNDSCLIHFNTSKLGTLMTVSVDNGTPCLQEAAGQDMRGYTTQLNFKQNVPGKFY